MPAESNPLALPETLPEEDVDRLYSMPLAEFTAARDALVKRLSGEKRRDAAQWAKGLRKPTVAAWIANQLVRRDRELTEALLRAGERLRAAQQGLAQGEADAQELRDASEKQRRIVTTLVDRAADLGEEVALTEATLDRVRETLRATALDDETRRLVESARLAHEASAVGLGLAAGTGSGAGTKNARVGRRRRTERAAPHAEEDGDERGRAAAEELRRLEDELREQKESVAAARTDVRDARRERDRLQRRLDDTTSRLEAGEHRLEQLERDAKAARRRVAELRKSSRR